MKLPHVTWPGPAIDDPELLDRTPEDLKQLLQQLNGFIQFHGGLHIRGACKAPGWHSLRTAWFSKTAFHLFYPSIEPGDIPFGEDCFGNQFLLAEDEVVFIDTETGERQPLDMRLAEFLTRASNNPEEFLQIEELLEFQASGGTLRPGELLAVVPPFCSRQANNGVSVGPVAAEERYAFLSNLASFVSQLPPGAPFDFKLE